MSNTNKSLQALLAGAPQGAPWHTPAAPLHERLLFAAQAVQAHLRDERRSRQVQKLYADGVFDGSALSRWQLVFDAFAAAPQAVRGHAPLLRELYCGVVPQLSAFGFLGPQLPYARAERIAEHVPDDQRRQLWFAEMLIDVKVDLFFFAFSDTELSDESHPLFDCVDVARRLITSLQLSTCKFNSARPFGMNEMRNHDFESERITQEDNTASRMGFSGRNTPASIFMYLVQICDWTSVADDFACAHAAVQDAPQAVAKVSRRLAGTQAMQLLVAAKDPGALHLTLRGGPDTYPCDAAMRLAVQKATPWWRPFRCSLNGYTLEACEDLRYRNPLDFGSPAQRDNDELARLAVRRDCLAYRALADRLKRDPEVATLAAGSWSETILDAYNRAGHDLNEANLHPLYGAPPEILTNADVMLVALNKVDCAESFVEGVWGDFSEAVGATWPLWQDRDFLLRLMKTKARVALKRAPLHFLDEDFLVRLAISEDAARDPNWAVSRPEGPEVLRRLRGNKSAMLRVVKARPLFLSLASKELRDDRDVVEAAVAAFGGAIGCASARLMVDKRIVLLALADDYGGWGLRSSAQVGYTIYSQGAETFPTGNFDSRRVLLHKAEHIQLLTPEPDVGEAVWTRFGSSNAVPVQIVDHADVWVHRPSGDWNFECLELPDSDALRSGMVCDGVAGICAACCLDLDVRAWLAPAAEVIEEVVQPLLALDATAHSELIDRAFETLYKRCSVERRGLASYLNDYELLVNKDKTMLELIQEAHQSVYGPGTAVHAREIEALSATENEIESVLGKRGRDTE
jgi:hypothetical protein